MKNKFLAFFILMVSCRHPELVTPEAGVSHALADARVRQIRHPDYQLSFTIPSTLEKAVIGEEDFYFDCLDDREPHPVGF